MKGIISTFNANNSIYLLF